MKFAAVIFDMDGLMLDTERIYRDMFNLAAADCGVEFPLWLHEKMLGRNSTDCRAILNEHWCDEPLVARFFDRSRHHHEVCFAAPAPLKPGLLELLDLIEERGTPKVVATSTRRAHAVPRLEQAGLLHRFATVSAGDDVQRGKPAPDLFLLAAASIGVPPAQCLVLEDSEAGIAAAHAAGMTACMVPDMKQPCEDIRRLAYGVYPSLAEVARSGMI